MAARDNGQGMFSMDFICKVADMRFEPAVALVKSHIDASTATTDNKVKAHAMVNNAKSLTKLVLGLGNFSLSHMGMKVIR